MKREVGYGRNTICLPCRAAVLLRLTARNHVPKLPATSHDSPCLSGRHDDTRQTLLCGLMLPPPGLCGNNDGPKWMTVAPLVLTLKVVMAVLLGFDPWETTSVLWESTKSWCGDMSTIELTGKRSGSKRAPSWEKQEGEGTRDIHGRT